MSKSKGNSVDPFSAIDTYGMDAVRFFLMRVGGNLATDADYSDAMLAEFQRKYLQGQLGNLLSRVLAPKIQLRLVGVARDAHEAQLDFGREHAREQVAELPLQVLALEFSEHRVRVVCVRREVAADAHQKEAHRVHAVRVDRAKRVDRIALGLGHLGALDRPCLLYTSDAADE